MTTQPINQPATLTTWTAPREKTNGEKAVWLAPWLFAMGSLLVASGDHRHARSARDQGSSPGDHVSPVPMTISRSLRAPP